MHEDAFGAARVQRKKPVFKNARVTDDVTERERLLYSFALKVTYIGKTAKSEIREYLWDRDTVNPEILKGAELVPEERELNFEIPGPVLEEIKEKAAMEEEKFQREVKEEREKLIEHLEQLAEEKEKEEKHEEAKLIREEMKRRKNAPMPELRVKIEPVALMALNAPVEIHRTVLENEFARTEKVWRFDNLTGEHELKCDGCGRNADSYYLTVDGLACESCYRECRECGKPMINANTCKVCHAPLCDEHTHTCSVCGAPLCEEHAEKCEFCKNEMCPEHVARCSVCGAPLCEEHRFTCSVCGATIGPKHTRICSVCGRDVCPEHVHRCAECGKSVCENCAVEIDGKWYCKEHLERTPAGIWVIPEMRCAECGVALSDKEAKFCDVCGAPLCKEHAHSCSECGKTLCKEHTHRCSICGAELCEEHTHISEVSGREYCKKHVETCPVCGRIMGKDESVNGTCPGCTALERIPRKSVPKEIFRKYPYVRHSRNWFISRGKTPAYITEIRGARLSYLLTKGEIREYRS